jgi:GNAT superfamily N-acetyltransferase
MTVDAQMIIAPAVQADLAELADLVNGAYRGTGEVRGWTDESAYIDGTRTSATGLAAEIARPDASLLTLRDAPEEAPLGCVFVEPAGEGDTWYLGLLSIRPDQQDRRLGRHLLEAGEAWARDHGARRVRITVVTVRESLIAWYTRRGYEPTGETEPFPYAESPFGAPRRPDLAFLVMEKAL